MQTQVKPGLKRKRGCSYSLGETKIIKGFFDSICVNSDVYGDQRVSTTFTDFENCS